jgi:hypothetical protein
MKFAPLNFQFYSFLLMVLYGLSNPVCAQEEKLFKPVIGIKIFNPWADPTLVYYIYEGSWSISPIYGFELSRENKRVGFEFRQHHFVSISTNISYYSTIAAYRRTTSIGSFSLGWGPNRDWGVGLSVSAPLSGIRFELRHEPRFYNMAILEGDKYSLNMLYRFNQNERTADSIASNEKLFRILLGARFSLNRHFRLGNAGEYNQFCTQGEIGLQMKIPNTKLALDLRNAVWISLSGGFSSQAVNGRTNMVSCGIVYSSPFNLPVGIGAEHFWMNDLTHGLLFPYQKIDFYPERGIGVYLSGKVNEHFIIEARQQYAYHINSQLSNIVKPSDEYRFSLGLYYTFRP